MTTIKFKNIGHSNANFECKVTGDVTEDFILEQVKPHCGSRNLEALLNKDRKSGIILGGFHQIGEFEFSKGIHQRNWKSQCFT